MLRADGLLGLNYAVLITGVNLDFVFGLIVLTILECDKNVLQRAPLLEYVVYEGQLGGSRAPKDEDLDSLADWAKRDLGLAGDVFVAVVGVAGPDDVVVDLAPGHMAEVAVDTDIVLEIEPVTDTLVD